MIALPDLLAGFKGLLLRERKRGVGTVSYTHLTLPTKRIV